MGQTDFIWKNDDEPHFKRRKEILSKIPEVKKLFGIDKWLKFKALFLIILHLGISIFFISDNLWVMLALALTIGSTLSSILFLAIHEITHDLAFKNKNANNWLAIITNIPLVFPYAMGFKIYHAEHHWHQGKDGIDVDIPSETEALIFKGFLGKLFWMINQILFYAVRPIAVYPLKPDKWQVLNVVIQIGAMALYFFYFGWMGIMYLAISMFFSGGLHPISGHFIAEHYVTKEGQETYSYYGPLNKITFNVGYHNEHHDFPNIPGSRLPKLRALANAHYENLVSYKSWSKILIRFVSDESISLYSRVKRK
jgi:sphingolipid 4-desaturase/C4-monooxygenase